MKRIAAFFVFLWASVASAAGPQPCYFSGQVYKCFVPAAISISGADGVVFNGSTSGTTTLKAAAAASGTLTMPAATDTLVGKATGDALTNKDMTSATNTFTAAGSSATGMVTSSAQSFGGLKTFDAGIKLPTSGGAAATLSYYEELTWTPAITCGSSGSVTYVQQVGTASKIGRMVVAGAYLAWSKNTCAGTLTISLPYATKTVSSGYQGTCSVTYAAGFTPSATYGGSSGNIYGGVTTYAANASSTLNLIWNKVNATPVSVASADTGGTGNEIMLSCSYTGS